MWENVNNYTEMLPFLPSIFTWSLPVRGADGLICHLGHYKMLSQIEPCLPIGTIIRSWVPVPSVVLLRNSSPAPLISSSALWHFITSKSQDGQTLKERRQTCAADLAWFSHTPTHSVVYHISQVILRLKAAVQKWEWFWENLFYSLKISKRRKMQMQKYIQQSVIILKPLTSDVKNSDYLVTIVQWYKSSEWLW